MSAQTYSNVEFDVSYSWLDVEKLSEKLDTWRQNLPSNLLLVSLLTQDHEVPLADRRSLLVVHMLYLQARLIAYQRKIQQSGVGEALRMPTSALKAYMGFARQLSRIIAFMFRDGHYMRCWLVLHSSFSSSIMLLIGVCQSLLQRPDFGVVSSDLLSVQDTCSLLVQMSDSFMSSFCFLRLLEPLYLQVKEIVNDHLGHCPHPANSTVQLDSTAADDQHVFDPSLLVVLIGQLVDALHTHDIIGYE
jgi:hypothetical protein